MKKVGIITLNGYTNYGNRLQNYALEQFLINNFNNVEVETIRYNARKTDFISMFKRMIKRNPREIFEVIRARKSNKNPEKDMNRLIKFKDFSKKYLNETEYAYTRDTLPSNISQNYNYFIVGSDQVWNPKNVYNDSFYFLQFAKIEQRIAYAPSFAVEEIGKEGPVYTKWINNFTHLSVREESGKDIIKKMTGREVPVLVDPTLLLSRSEWEKLAKKHENKNSDKYILTYFLGENVDQGETFASTISKKYNLKIISLNNVENDYYDTDPREFLDFINGASLVLTDSFHGTVFSVIFEVPFVTFKRGDTNSRINTLLKMFDLENRKYENMEFVQLFFVDFATANLVIKEEKNKSNLFLKNALGE